MTAPRTPITVHGCPTHPRYDEACRIALGPLPATPVVGVTFPYPTGPYSVHVDVLVRDRDTGEPRWFGFSGSFAGADICDSIAVVLERAYRHETWEGLYEGGVRYAEPHPEGLAVPADADDSAQRGRGVVEVTT